jgi:protein gp37
MQAYFTVATWLRLGNLIEKVKPDELWNGNACQAQWHIRDCRPFPNIWLGVSVEDQKRADERIPPLLETPAAIRFISAEPLLGPVDISLYLASGYLEPPHTDIINWVIVGGESGSGARPMHPAWPAVLRDQCIGAGIPFFFKQWGEWSPYTAIGCAERETAIVGEGFHAYQLIKTGKKVAGRVLDGRTWDEFPDNRAAA